MNKLEIIDDTVAYYSTHPRSLGIDDNGDVRCRYKGNNGTECAFQRCVETDLSEFEGRSASYIIPNDQISFKEGYNIEDVGFWQDIQYLHDGGENWENGELSEYGADFVKRLKEKYQ